MKLIELREKIGESGLDLLWQLLEVDPSKRISADKALNHQFFDGVSKKQMDEQENFIENYQGNID
jgi:serine/threonine protein kinase